MPFEKSLDMPKTLAAPPCIHLRNKAVCVTGDLQSLEGTADSEGHCWCTLTQHVRGPDQHGVSRASCVPGRSCYRDSH